VNRRFLLGGLTGAVLVGLVLVAVLAIAGLQITDSDVKVPSLLGDRPSVAQARVQGVGLKVRIVRSSAPTDPFGLFSPPQAHVTRQIPESNTSVPGDATVTLFVDYR
jgi:beta-lactam-binding protein with PASTA domain